MSEPQRSFRLHCRPADLVPRGTVPVRTGFLVETVQRLGAAWLDSGSQRGRHHGTCRFPDVGVCTRKIGARFGLQASGKPAHLGFVGPVADAEHKDVRCPLPGHVAGRRPLPVSDSTLACSSASSAWIAAISIRPSADAASQVMPRSNTGNLILALDGH
jgi:hypothetical protein